MESKVAVIVPCHNAARYLGATVDALLKQDFALPYRILLVDDASTDQTPALIRSLEGYAPGIIMALTSQAGNLPQARNTALAEALKSDYVCFSDADDVPHPDFISSLYRLITSTGADCACRGYRIIDENGGRIKTPQSLETKTPLTGPEAAFQILKDDRVKAYVWCKIFSAPLLRRTNIAFLPERFVYEDLVWCFQTFLASDRVAFSREPVYDYLIHRGSLSHRADPQAFMMHVCAYAACRAYSSFLLGEEASLKMFKRARGTMVFKCDCDILTARKLYPEGIAAPRHLARELVGRICSPEFRIVGEPWERYIIDLGFLGHPQLTQG